MHITHEFFYIIRLKALQITRFFHFGEHVAQVVKEEGCVEQTLLPLVFDFTEVPGHIIEQRSVTG